MNEMINYGDLKKMESILKTRHNYDEHQRNEGRVGMKLWYLIVLNYQNLQISVFPRLAISQTRT